MGEETMQRRNEKKKTLSANAKEEIVRDAFGRRVFCSRKVSQNIKKSGNADTHLRAIAWKINLRYKIFNTKKEIVTYTLGTNGKIDNRTQENDRIEDKRAQGNDL